MTGKMAESADAGSDDQNNAFAPNYDSDVADHSRLGELAKIAAKVMEKY